ncbi:uncharacterized protein BN750_00974 [Bacteroides sp. CAG:661]|nr:uncharacterized protein BN750_00974 [Bacteroides sp. CAG:661]
MIDRKFLIKLSIIAYAILSINSYTAWIQWNPLSSSLTMTFIENFFVFIVLLYPGFKYNCISKNYNQKGFGPLNFYILYTIGLSIYSLIVNTSCIEKHDFASLWMSIQAMLSIILVYTLIYPFWFYQIFRIILKLTPWLLICLIPIAKEENLGGLFGFIFRPISFILIFITILNNKNKLFYSALAIATVILSYIYDARSNMIIPVVCFLLGITINLKFYTSKLKHTVWLFIIAPLILFYTGLTGTFNIFEMDKYVKGQNISEGTISDTRTLVYTEVLSSATKNAYTVWGRGIGRGYESLFQERRSFDNKLASKRSANERNSEVGIHNIFTWGGVVYLTVYTFMWISIIYYGVYKSKNNYIPAIAFYLGFYFLYSWIENFQSFSITYIYSWLLVALCLSPYFRNMNNNEFKLYIKRITR